MSTKMNLGKGNAFVVKAKSKYKPIRYGFCTSATCCCTVQLDEKNQCLRCFNKVIKRQTHDAMKKWFNKFIGMNANQIENMFFDMHQSNTLHIQVPDHKRIYYVPVRYFVEYSNLFKSDDYVIDKETAVDSFFSYIKETCFSQQSG